MRQGGDISPIVHKPICEFVSDDSIKRKGVAMPRKLRKTTICDRWFPIWCYLRDHEERILLGAETLDIASASMDWIKDTIIGNRLLRWCYPEIAVSESWANKNKWSGVAINLPRDGTYAEPTIKALGVGGAGQSRHFTAYLPHGHLRREGDEQRTHPAKNGVVVGGASRHSSLTA